MAVHYKLKSSRKFESVFFEGHEITGRELKAEIAAKQVCSTPAFAPGLAPLTCAYRCSSLLILGSFALALWQHLGHA